MKKFFWLLLLIILFPLMPIPIIGFIIYYLIKHKHLTWPPKTEPHAPIPAPIHPHRSPFKHRHKPSRASDQELRLRLGILLLGVILGALLIISKK